MEHTIYPYHVLGIEPRVLISDETLAGFAM